MERNDVCRRMVDVENRQQKDILVGLQEGPKRRGPIDEMINETSKIPLFEGSTLSSLCIILLILNCCRTHNTSNAFITELLGLLKKTVYPPQIHYHHESMRLLAA